MNLARHLWPAFVLIAVMLLQTANGADKVRVYPLGEADANPTTGGDVTSTEDIQEPPTEDEVGDPVFDSAGEFVPLEAIGSPTYVEGRDGPGSFAIRFDGEAALISPAFDPRNFSSFAAISQAWVKLDAAGQGESQVIWGLGNDNGGVGITSAGNWELRSGGSAGSIEGLTPVDFQSDEWQHVAVFRGGNGANLYINGALEIANEGFWNGPGDVIVGEDSSGANPFFGDIDDFNIAGFSDGTFDLVEDIDFWNPDEFSGVLGDIDQDGLVNDSDYLIWSENVGFNNGLGDGDVTTLISGDADQNGRINNFDFQIIAQQAAAAGNPLNAVPEPASSGMLVLGMLLTSLLIRRRSR